MPDTAKGEKISVLILFSHTTPYKRSDWYRDARGARQYLHVVHQAPPGNEPAFSLLAEHIN